MQKVPLDDSRIPKDMEPFVRQTRPSVTAFSPS